MAPIEEAKEKQGAADRQDWPDQAGPDSRWERVPDQEGDHGRSAGDCDNASRQEENISNPALHVRQRPGPGGNGAPRRVASAAPCDEHCNGGCRHHAGG